MEDITKKTFWSLFPGHSVLKLIVCKMSFFNGRLIAVIKRLLNNVR